MKARTLTLALTSTVVFAGSATAQDMNKQEQPRKLSAAPSAAWSDPEFAAIAQALSGSWKSGGDVKVMGTANSQAGVVISIAPVAVGGVPDAMYVEIALEGQINRPYRQCIWRLYKGEGKMHLQTLEFRRRGGLAMQVAGLWAAPEAFPSAITSDDLVATMDIDLAGGKDKWTGRTAHAYPTFSGGATSMTTELSIAPGAIEVTDTGFGPDGKKLWGGDKVSFSHTDLGVGVTRHDAGVIVIDYPTRAAGEIAKPGDTVNVHYVGYLGDGRVFDSSYDHGAPLTYQQGATFAIKGWSLATANIRAGEQCRIIVPPAMAFGSAGDFRLNVPKDATLYFDVQVLSVSHGNAPVPNAAAPSADVQKQMDAKKAMMEKEAKELEQKAIKK